MVTWVSEIIITVTSVIYQIPQHRKFLITEIKTAKFNLEVIGEVCTTHELCDTCDFELIQYSSLGILRKEFLG